METNEKIPEAKEHRERSPRSNQKLKIMYLMKILMQETDPELVTNSLKNKVDQMLVQMSVQAVQYIERFRKSEIGGSRIDIESIFDENANIKKLISQPIDILLKDALSDRRFSIVSKVDQKVYITQSGQKYHRANCPFCKRYKLIETTHSKVSNAGYEPCRCIGATDKVTCLILHYYAQYEDVGMTFEHFFNQNQSP